MLSPQDENLKKVEPKEAQASSGAQNAPSVFQPDRKKIIDQVRQRKAKLDQIKPHIPLKTYHALQEKLAGEETALKQRLTVKEQQIQKEKQEQSLPKVFFEQKLLKPKAIRIE